MATLLENVKFKIIFNDGTHMESHDENWNMVRDHANALAPHNEKPWSEYHLIGKDGFFVKVNFNTGVFNLNGIYVHPSTETGVPLTNRENDKQNFNAQHGWSILNNLHYFPRVGRLVFKGDTGEAVIPYCGWKHQFNETTTYEKVCYFYPNNQIVLQ